MPKHLILSVIISVISISTRAQNEPQSTLFTSSYVNFNPAMSGVNYQTEANVLWRNQWTQVNGAPAVLWGNYTQRLDQIHGAAGIIYQYDYIGYSKTHSALANYAYHIQTEKILWSFGASAGVKFLDPWNSNTYYSAFSSNAGIVIHTENLNAGFSVTQINKPRFKNQTNGTVAEMSPTFHLHADYSFHLGEKWNITPALHLFTDRIKLASTTSIKATFNNKLWFGANAWNLFSSTDSFVTIGPMIGYDFKEQFRVGYSLEFNEFKIYENEPNLTHEVVLSFLLK